MRPQASYGSIGQAGFRNHKMMICCFNILLESLIRMTLVQSYQTSPHRTVVIQALVSINHMPSKTGNRPPSSFTESFIIQTMKIRLISLVKINFIFSAHNPHISGSVFYHPTPSKPYSLLRLYNANSNIYYWHVYPDLKQHCPKKCILYLFYIFELINRRSNNTIGYLYSHLFGHSVVLCH